MAQRGFVLLGMLGLKLSRIVMQPGGTSVRLGLRAMRPRRLCVGSRVRLVPRGGLVGERAILALARSLLAGSACFSERF